MDTKESPNMTITPRRRLRSTKSCQPCRRRKTKCDCGSPCGMCRARGVSPAECVYETLAEKQSRDAREVVNRPLAQKRPNPVPNASHASKAGASISAHPSSAGTSHQISQPAPPPPQDDAIFGLWSTNSFIRRTMAAIDPEGEQTQKLHPGNGNSMMDAAGFSNMCANDLRYNIETLSLPGKHIADSMIRAYWQYVHPLFPILHQPSFAPQFESLWQSKAPQGPSSSSDQTPTSEQSVLLYAIVNAVLAIGCQRCEDIPNDLKARDAEALYKRSVQLVSVESLDFYSVEVVQLLLLRAVYLQFTPFASRCWSTLGVALRAAQGIGLHIDQPGRPQLEREMRRRIWHAFVLLEGIASVMFGWPETPFASNAVPRPLAIDDEYLSAEVEGSQPAGKPSFMEFYLCYVQLCDFFTPDRMKAPLAVSLHPTDRRSLMDLMHYIGEVPKRFLEFDHLLKNLPTCFKEADENPKLDGRFRAQRHFLITRILYAQVNVMRPCMVASILSRFRPSLLTLEEPSLSKNLMVEINELCVQNACNILNECYTYFHMLYQPMTWQLLRVTFGSASIILAATVLPDLQVDLSIGPHAQAWDQAIAVLDAYMMHDVTAQNAKKALLEYRSRFEAAMNRLDAANYTVDHDSGGPAGPQVDFTHVFQGSTSGPFLGMGLDTHMQEELRGIDDFLNLNVFDWC